MIRRHHYVGSPACCTSCLEPRALLEAAALPWSLPWLARTPKGDGHPVLLLPASWPTRARWSC